MADRFAPGDRVRTRTADPPGHTRLPRYARGVVGEIVGTCGRHPLADERAQGLESAPRAVHQVRFRAGDLFGPDGATTPSSSSCGRTTWNRPTRRSRG